MDSNFLFEMDQKCSGIINTIIEKENELFTPGMSISFTGCTKKLKLYQNVGIIELKKMKQEFLSIAKLHPPKSLEDAGEMFVSFLESALERMDKS